MWRRAAPLLLHLAAAAGIAGRRVRPPPLPPVPTIPSPASTSASASYSSRHNLGSSRDPVGAPSRSLSDQAGGGSVCGECWSCGARGAFLSCGSCGSVQPVDPAVDYFRIFGLKGTWTHRLKILNGDSCG